MACISPSTRIRTCGRFSMRLRLSTPCETRFERANFAVALDALAQEGMRADGILMDLGISSMQMDRPERGFSYARQAPP